MRKNYTFLINVNLSKRNVKLILKILNDLEPFFATSESAHECPKKPNLHTNSLNKLRLLFICYTYVYVFQRGAQKKRNETIAVLVQLFWKNLNLIKKK
jgi:hypothetical protein